MMARHTISILRIAALLLVLGAPFVFNAYWLFLILQVVVSAYLALSVDIAYSQARVLSFCQGLFFAVAAYAAAALASSAPWGLAAMLCGGTLVAAVLGAILGIMLMRMHTHGAIIATVILAAASLLIANALGAYTGGDDGLGLQSTTIGVFGGKVGVGLNTGVYYIAALPLVAIICLLWRLQGTLTWTVIRAVAQNDVRARLLGYNVTLRRYVVFVASAAVAGFGGSLYALVMNHVTTGLFDIGVSVNAILFAVVGGLGTDCGALIGALLILPATELVAGVFTYVQIVVGLLLAVVAIAAPKGIIGTLRERADAQAADGRDAFESSEHVGNAVVRNTSA